MNQLELFTMSEAALRKILGNPPAPFDGDLEANVSQDEDSFDPEAVVENAMREVALNVVKKPCLRSYMEAYTCILHWRRERFFPLFDQDLADALEETAYGIWFVVKGSKAVALHAEAADVEFTPEDAVSSFGEGMEAHVQKLRELHTVLLEALLRLKPDEVLVFRGDRL